jgi:hypothetical protein
MGFNSGPINRMPKNYIEMKKKPEYQVTCKFFPADIVQRVSRLHADLALARLETRRTDLKPGDGVAAQTAQTMMAEAHETKNRAPASLKKGAD